MKVLVWNGKHDPCYWRADTPENERWAFAQMFKALDDFEAYIEIKSAREIKNQEKELKQLERKYGTIKDNPDFATEAKYLDEQIRDTRRHYTDTLHEQELYIKAKAGDHAAAKALCQLRKDAEYEGFDFVEVEEP